MVIARMFVLAVLVAVGVVVVSMAAPTTEVPTGTTTEFPCTVVDMYKYFFFRLEMRVLQFINSISLIHQRNSCIVTLAPMVFQSF